MALKFDVLTRNAELDAIESNIGVLPRLLIYTGGSPLITDGATGTLLYNSILPSDWMNAASGGTKTKNGTWSGSAIDSGIAGYFRIIDSGSTAKIQGSCSGSAGSGDMILDNTSINVAQTVTIQTFTLNAGNA